MALSALIAAWLAGTLGSLHCLAMCGGFVTALSSASRGGVAPMLPARSLAWRQVPYNLGRIATYAALGAAFGGAGSAALSAAQWMPLQQALYVIANVFLLLLGLAVAGRGRDIGWFSRAGGTLFARMAALIRPLAIKDNVIARTALGAIWGLVPCGLVYGVLPVALFSGSAVSGAAVMLAFGIGTLPSLIAAGMVVSRVKPWISAPAVRYAAAAVLVGFALVGIARALTGSIAHGQGAFCLVV